jgi:hypothetical protein
MIGSEYSWLLSLSRAARGGMKIRLARGGLLTLGIGLFCLSCLLGGGPHAGACATPVAPAPAEITLPQDAGSEWPRVFLRLWFLAPTILPHDR